MTTVNVYLNFNGNCRQAFEFYKSVFGGEIPYTGTYGEMPQQEGMPPMPEEVRNRIMHISLPISNETTLMGADFISGFGPDLVVGNNISIIISCDSKKETDRIFNVLGVGGTVTMPLSDTFWGAYFGMLTDQFGINWMLSYELPKT